MTAKTDQNVHLDGPNTFESWDRTFGVMVEGQKLSKQIFDGEEMKPMPDPPSLPVKPKAPLRADTSVSPPAGSTRASTRASTAPESTYEEKYAQWERDIM